MAWTPTTWSEQVLQDANAEDPTAPSIPIDPNTVGDMTHWMPAEEPTTDWYDRNNPLNASLGTGSTDGTGSYPNLAVAAEETAAMIDQTNMSGIRSALAANDSTTGGFSQAVVDSPWAAGHYGGTPNNISTTSPGGGVAPTTASAPGTMPILASSTGGSGAPASDASIGSGLLTFFSGGATGDFEHWAGMAIVAVVGLGIIGLGLYKLASPDTKGAVKDLATQSAPQSAAPLAEAAA
jgi:hypothetical protein